MAKLFVTKRNLLRHSALIATGLAAPALLLRPAVAQDAEKNKSLGEKLVDTVTGGNHDPKQVTPPEDLMREHGLLDRVLLIYEASIGKLGSNADVDPALITQSAEIVRDFIHNYHEESEEKQVFPRFQTAGQMIALVDVLWKQHKAGKKVTEKIIHLAPTARSNADDRRDVVAAMQAFITMYRPHAAREDTDLFPKLKTLVSGNEYDAIAEDFEKQEHKLFGDDGFEKMLARVAPLEQQIGIADLDQFTPKT